MPMRDKQSATGSSFCSDSCPSLSSPSIAFSVVINTRSCQTTSFHIHSHTQLPPPASSPVKHCSPPPSPETEYRIPFTRSHPPQDESLVTLVARRNDPHTICGLLLHLSLGLVMGHFDTVVVQTPSSHHFYPQNDSNTSCVLFAAHVATDEVSWNNTDSGYLLRTFDAPNQSASFPTYSSEPSVSNNDQFASSYSGNEVVSSMATLMSGSENGYPDYAGGGDVSPEEVAAAAYRPCNYQAEDGQYSECYGEYRAGADGQWDGYPAEQIPLKQEDQTSGDSAFSSMASGRVSSSSDEWGDTASETSSHPSDQHNVYSRSSGGKADFLHSQQYYSYSRSANSYSGHHVAPYGTEMGENEVYHNHTYSASRNVTASDVAAAVKARQPSSRKVKSEVTDEESVNSDDSEETQFSRDEKRARLLNIPIPICDIINLPIDEFNEKLAKYDMTEAQLSLIRDIRRRGKNKVAAQNCRKRKMDQIHGLQTDVDRMLAQKVSLEARQAHLLSLRDLARDKYEKLFKLVLDSQSHYHSDQYSSETPPDDPRPSRTLSVLTSDPRLPHDVTGTVFNSTFVAGAAAAAAAMPVAELE